METEELLGKCAFQKESGEDYVAWAETMLAKGCSNENVEILAALGLEKPVNIFEAKAYFQNAATELKIEIPCKEDCIVAYARYLAKKIVNGQLAPVDGAKMLFRLCSNAGYPESLIMWYMLDEDIDYFYNKQKPIYNSNMNESNMDQMIIDEAKQFLGYKKSNLPQHNKTILDHNRKTLKILKFLLFCGGFGFFISIFGVFMPWSAVAEQLEGLGAKELPADPMLNYWLRMQAGANTFVGLFLFALALNPLKYRNVLPFAWILLIGEGCILLIWGLLLKLSPLPFAVDSAFCLVIGTGILLVSKKIKSEPRQ